jgi:hypothetical protein
LVFWYSQDPVAHGSIILLGIWLIFAVWALFSEGRAPAKRTTQTMQLSAHHKEE